MGAIVGPRRPGVAGAYRDVVFDPSGAVRLARWGHNVVCDRIWPLVAGLLARDPALASPLYLAVGAGRPEWDEEDRAPAPEPTTVRLVAEVARRPLATGDVGYRDADGRPSGAPTAALRLTATFTWPGRAPTLREFGLFGGDATDRADSGYQIDHVVHPRLDLAPGEALARSIDLAFDAGTESAHPPVSHWIGDEPVSHVEGVGPRLALRLADVGVRTMGQAARLDPASRPGIPVPRLAALRARCRMVIWAVGRLPSGTLASLHPEDVLTIPAKGLADATGTPPDLVERVREQVATLEACLDHAYLSRFTVGDLASPVITPRP